MKYRIQAVVGAERLADVVQALCTGGIDYDPVLQITPYSEPPAKQAKQEKKARRPPSSSPSRSMLVEEALKTGPKRWSQLKTALTTGGLSESSLNGLIGQWRKQGKIQRSAEGLWSLMGP